MKPNPREDFNAPETYGPMGDLRFQLAYWVNDKEVNNYQYEHGADAVVMAGHIKYVLKDLKTMGVITSWGIRIDDLKTDKSSYLRVDGMKLDTYEKCLEQFYTDHPECHPDYPENQ